MSDAAFDTSALVKLAMSEPGFETVGELWLASEHRVCVRLAHVEGHAALSAAHRQKRLDGSQLVTARRRLNALWLQVSAIEVGESLTRRAIALVQRHPLKGYDAVHVAAALDTGVRALVTSDRTQAEAARAENLNVVTV